MDETRFSKRSPGALVPIAEGGRAFVPEPFPCRWQFPDSLWPLLAEAKARVALLEGIGRTLPDPGILLRPLEDREAIQSSRLEGTYVTAQELLLFELEPRTPKGSDDQVNDRREVHNYRTALHDAVASPLPLSLRLIRNMHRTLMSGVRGRDQTPGEFRKQQVAIGHNRRFVPPPPERLPNCLDNFEKHLHREWQLDPLVECFLCHYQFETIHPFSDGNGRIGRLLLSLMLQQRCGLTKPWLYLSEFFERHREEYCDLLFNISARGDWEPWIEFCLRGTIAQAETTVQRCEKLQSIRAELMLRLAHAGGSVRLNRIVDGLFVSPYVRIVELTERLGVTYPTARADVKRLETVGILQPLPNASPATFYSKEVFSVAYAGVED